MADFRDELRTAAQRETYLRNVAGITAAKSSKEYRNAYRYLTLVSQGKRAGNKSERFRLIRDVATINAERRDPDSGVSLPPETPSPPVRNYNPGDTISGTIRFKMPGEPVRTKTASFRLTDPDALYYANRSGGGNDLAFALLIEYLGLELARYAEWVELV